MKKIAVAAVIAALVATAACNSSGPARTSGVPNPPFQGNPPQDVYVYEGETGVHGGSLVLATPDDLSTYNIVLATDNATADVIWFNVFRCLVDYRNGADPPDYDSGLCTRWEVSPDAKQWTFYLRRGLRWSDGEPFTADDVIFTFDVVRDPKVQTPIRDMFREDRDAAGNPVYPDVVKLDDHTVRFDLHKPNGTFLDLIFNLWLIPKHKWEGSWRSGSFNETMKLDGDPREIVGLGPYVIKEYVSGQRVVLERNPYFWKVDRKGQRLPYLDQLVYVIVKDFNTVLAKFEGGEIDVMSRVRPQDYALVKRMESPSVKVEDIGVSYDTNWITLNQNPGADPRTHKKFVADWKLRLFRDQRFRQAVSYAIDREGLAKTVFSSRAVPIYSFVSPGDKMWFSDEVMKYPLDPARSRQLLADIGLKDRNGDGFLEDSEGHTVEFDMSVNASNSQRIETAVVISRNLKDVGIKANVNAISALGAIGQLLQQTFNFDAIVLGWQISPPPGPSGTKNTILSSGFNHACFPNQTKPSTDWEELIDRRFQELETHPDPAERKRLWSEIQRIWSEQLPEINLVAALEAVAYRNKFGNIKAAALPPRVTWNCEEIYVRQ
ncbi:MAG TPA: ABC transporter substrate-binding protein [Blastocatellia bacterium]|nr:ABC transporter substrate-binding protein [Blastocatellia bacterium]